MTVTTVLRRSVAFGTGIGIRIGREDLILTVTRVRPSGIRVLGELTVPRFRDQPAAEWGARCLSFLKKLGATHLAASVLLPREDIIVRQLSLPGVSDSDLPGAIRFQVDSLHPWPEEDAVYDFARMAGNDAVLIAVTRRSVIEQWANLFAEAGIKVAGFTVSAAAIWSALRLVTVPGHDFLAFSQNGSFELYGESASKPIFSASPDTSADRAIQLAVSELRLPPDSEPVALGTLLPRPVAVPEGTDLSHTALPYAASMSAACPHLAMRLNLLPEQQRQASSRALFVPTIVLAAMVLVTAAGLLFWHRFENRRYLDQLHGRISRLEPLAARAVALDKQIVQTRNRTLLLDAFRGRTKEDMDALNELTRLLAAPSWIHSMQMNGREVSLSGETDQPAALLRLLDTSPRFQNSQFTTPIQHTGTGETFALRAQRKGMAE
jgi:Tfp pilus assembly protein PilN